MSLFVLACGNEPAVNAQTIKGNFLNKRQQGKNYFFTEQKVIINIKLIVLKLI